MISIQEKVADCLVRAGSTFREDQKDAYRKAIALENSEKSCWVMRQILDNALVAEERRSPLCDDTGIPHLFLEVGKNRSVTGELLEQIKEGVALGLRQLPGRPMAIKGDDYARIDQSGGLNEDSGALAPSPILIKPVDEDVLRLTVLMLGGLGGKHSVLATFAKIGPQRASGVRIVALRPCCCFEPRRASVEL